MSMKFFTKNYLEDVTVGNLTASTGNSVVGLIKDRNLNSRWVSVGSNDTITETITAIWTAAVTINYISLRNMNLETYTVQYWTGAAYADFSTPINETTNTSTARLHGFNTVSTTRIRLTATTTIIPNDEKRIGELMAYFQHIDIPDEWLPDTEEPVLYDKKSEHEKVDGGNLIVYEAVTGKYQNSFNWSVLSDTYTTQFLALKALHSSFWILPDSSAPYYQYYVNWVDDYNFKKIEGWTTTGIRCYSGNMEVKEV